MKKPKTEPALIQIMKHMRENRGKIPNRFIALVGFLQANAIICNLKNSPEGCRAELAPAHASYYQQYLRMKVGPSWSRWLWTLRYFLFPSADLDSLRASINQVEAAAAPTARDNEPKLSGLTPDWSV